MTAATTTTEDVITAAMSVAGNAAEGGFSPAERKPGCDGTTCVLGATAAPATSRGRSRSRARGGYSLLEAFRRTSWPSGLR